MKLKKAAAALFAVLLCTVLCLPASAAEWEGEDFTFTVPEEFVYTFGPQTPQDDPSWALAGIPDPASVLQEYQEMGVVADFYSEGRELNVKVMRSENDTSKSIYNLRDLSEEEKTQYLDKVQSQTEDITIEKGFIEVDGQPFYRVRMDGTIEEEEFHELQYGTILNGYRLTFITYNEGKDLTEEQSGALETMVNSMRITQLLETPQLEPVSVWLILGLLVLIVAIVVGPFIYIPLRNRWDKKQKAKMAERLSQYRQTHGEGVSLGAPKFVNETECTREAVRAFCLYHSYGKNLPSLLFGGAVCLVALVVVFVFDVTWWLKLLAVGAAIYFAYKAINMPNAMEKVQRKVFSRGVSSTARYTFYDDGFRVAGIQSASLYPYFQITAVRRHGQYLYLYYGPDNAYPVDQYGFTLGEFEDFARFIKDKTTEQESKFEK